MSKSYDDDNALTLALFVLYKKMNRPYDLIKYWSIFGPCIEEHPDIEKCGKD